MPRTIRGAVRGWGVRAAALVALLALAAGLLAACGDDDEQQQDAEQTTAQQQDQQQEQQAQPTPAATPQQAVGEPLKIGFLADYSGPIAEFGPAIELGARLAIQHLNEGRRGLRPGCAAGDRRHGA